MDYWDDYVSLKKYAALKNILEVLVYPMPMPNWQLNALTSFKWY